MLDWLARWKREAAKLRAHLQLPNRRRKKFRLLRQLASFFATTPNAKTWRGIAATKERINHG